MSAEPAITNCPTQLESILSAALKRWESKGITHRIFQAEDALQEAASACCSKSWNEPQTLLLAEFAYWMVAFAFDEEEARQAKAQASQAASIGDLSTEEIEMIRRSRAAAAAAAAKKGKR